MLLMFERGIRGGITQAIHTWEINTTRALRPVTSNTLTPTIFMDGQCPNDFQLVDLDGLTLNLMKFENWRNAKTKGTY